MHWSIWLVLVFIFIVLEILTPTFFIIWFSIGALVALILSLTGFNLTIQLIGFLLVSTLSIFLTKPFVKKFTSKTKRYKTNSQSVIGEIALVTKDIKAGEDFGQVKINGEIWTANSKQNLSEGDRAKVLAIDGVKLIVEKK